MKPTSQNQKTSTTIDFKQKILPLSLLKTSQGHPMFGAAIAGGLTAEKGKRKHVPTAADESGILKSNNYNSLTSSKKEFGISDGDDISEKHLYYHVKLEHVLSSQTAGSRALTSLIWLNSNPRIPAATSAYVDRKLAWFRELLTGVFNNLSRNQLMQRQCEEECLGLARLLPPMETALLDWLMNLMADYVSTNQFNWLLKFLILAAMSRALFDYSFRKLVSLFLIFVILADHLERQERLLEVVTEVKRVFTAYYGLPGLIWGAYVHQSCHNLYDQTWSRGPSIRSCSGFTHLAARDLNLLSKRSNKVIECSFSLDYDETVHLS
ncbi:hypothetical protein Tco_1337301 [Tanacetum coccineum]